ncbi:hypothetical protein SERN_0727 [Serinibacter arcticus]|uniref:Uncharacterized protein n=1 Tax=Serinibacter arcticus TaxID=1655435 RepID=A0A4Z1E360_9MICO|nr:hypothetical protein SERN_0727 [Serinibacter arcticus]
MRGPGPRTSPPAVSARPFPRAPRRATMAGCDPSGRAHSPSAW